MSEFSNVKAYRNNHTEVLVFLNVLWTAKLSGHLAKFKGQERIMNITKVTKNITAIRALKVRKYELRKKLARIE